MTPVSKMIPGIMKKQDAECFVYQTSLLMVLLLSTSSYYLAVISNDNISNDNAYLGTYTLLQFSAMSFFMLLAWRYAPNYNRIRDYGSLLFIAVAARIVLVGVDPYTSNDVDRYLFDGRIALSGLDPYQVSHDSPLLTQLRAVWQPPEEHAGYVTLYPPLALALFSIAAAAGVEYAQLVWSLMTLFAGIATLLIGALMLEKTGKLSHLPLLALSPILILETSVGLHLDAFSTLAVVAAIYAWQNERVKLCAGLIGAGALLKILPIMLLLPLFFSQTRLHRALSVALITLTTVASGYAVAWFMGLKPIGSIGVFFQKWRFGSPLFNVFDDVLEPATSLMLCIALVLCASAIIGYICVSIQRENKSEQPISFFANQNSLVNCLQFAVALPLLLSPVVFPWYLMPLIPLLALKPNIYLLLWVCVMPLTYEVLNQFSCCQIWMPAQWPVWLLSAVFGLALFKLLFHPLSKVGHHA